MSRPKLRKMKMARAWRRGIIRNVELWFPMRRWLSTYRSIP